MKIIYATMTGNARECAEEVAKKLEAEIDLQAEIIPVEEYETALLPSEDQILILTSTFGNGEAPDPAYRFWEQLLDPRMEELPDLRYAVLAFGDKSYPRFCQFGKDLDHRLNELGATRILDVETCDVDFEETFEEWCNKLQAALKSKVSEIPAET